MPIRNYPFALVVLAVVMLGWCTLRTPVTRAAGTALLAPASAASQPDTEELTPTVKITRRGRTLQLDCTLTNDAGQPQTLTNSQRIPPHFTICAGDREVGSGDFEFG